MATIKDTFARFIVEDVLAGEAVDNTTYDHVGRFSANTAVVCTTGEAPNFIFLGDADGDAAAYGVPVKVAIFGYGNVAARLYGTGSAGDKLTWDGLGRIVASATDPADPLGANDIGIAREDWTSGELTLITII